MDIPLAQYSAPPVLMIMLYTCIDSLFYFILCCLFNYSMLIALPCLCGERLICPLPPLLDLPIHCCSPSRSSSPLPDPTSLPPPLDHSLPPPFAPCIYYHHCHLPTTIAAAACPIFIAAACLLHPLTSPLVTCRRLFTHSPPPITHPLNTATHYPIYHCCLPSPLTSATRHCHFGKILNRNVSQVRSK